MATSCRYVTVVELRKRCAQIDASLPASYPAIHAFMHEVVRFALLPMFTVHKISGCGI